MKKKNWATFSATEVDKDSNRVKLEGDPSKILEVTVVDENGSAVKRHTDVLRNEHKILMTMKFQWGTTNYQDTSSNNIEYFIKKADDCWEVNKDKDTLTVKAGKKAKFEEAKSEIHKHLFEKEFSDEVGSERKEAAGVTDIKYVILRDGKGGYKVNIYQGDKDDVREFPWEQVEIVPQFYQNKQVDFDNIFTIKYQEENEKSQLTAGWIIFFVTLLVIITFGIIFRKKLWRWIKGERKQEKKVREQIDIF